MKGAPLERHTTDPSENRKAGRVRGKGFFGAVPVTAKTRLDKQKYSSDRVLETQPSRRCCGSQREQSKELLVAIMFIFIMFININLHRLCHKTHVEMMEPGLYTVESWITITQHYLNHEIKEELLSVWVLLNVFFYSLNA